MRRILLVFFFAFTQLTLFAQFTTDQYTYRKSIDFKNSNTWAVGGGLSNFIMHGDLRSIGTGNQGNFWNFGGYVYVDKMFNPLLGLELKLNYNKISGGAQYFSDIYDVLYVDGTQITNNLFFDGRAYGAELNLIFSFSNLYIQNANKWHFSGYLGMGYHQYNSELFERNPDGSATSLVDFGLNPARNSVNEASSVYLSIQAGIKYRINKRVDIEFRPSWYFNYEDHLDATISNKQDWETFFVTHVGVAIKLGKEKIFTIWGDDEEVKDSITGPGLQLVDTDNDGVIDQLDKEPNTPKGVMVYANGISVDSDSDGLPDYKDACRFEPGPANNDGCPITGDQDKDGIADRKDKCIDQKGFEKYDGCPNEEALKLKEIVEVLSYSKNIYFDTDSNEIKSATYYTMLDEVATIMLKNPNVSFSVSGYTDDRGDEAYNQRLSERRANEARLYLIARGVESDRVSSAGYGELNPKYDNATEQGRQLNRRVEIKSVGPYEKKTRIVRDKDE
jgi:outer membrane protein OmpA-like peptidoglycan-associated protein